MALTSIPRYWLNVGSDGMGEYTTDLHNPGRGLILTDAQFVGSTFTATLVIAARDQRWRQRRFEEISRALRYAGRAALPFGHGARVTISVQLSPDQMVYLDVLGGTLTPTVRYPGGATWECKLIAQCEPYSRGEPISYSATATQTNGGTAAIWVQNVPGNAPALARWQWDTTVSTNSKIVQRIRWGVYSEWELGSSSFPNAIPATTGDDAASASEANTIGGVRKRVTVGQDWKNVAKVSLSVRGLLQLWVRLRDSATATAATVSITSAVTDYTAGSLTVGSYTYVVVVYDSSVRVIAISKPKIVVTNSESGASHQTTLTWTAVPGASNHRIYWKLNTGAYQYLASGSSSNTYTHSTTAGATTADPATSADAAITNALIRVRVALPTGEVITTYPTFTSQLANSYWEHVLAGQGPFPPLSRGESTALSDACLLFIDAKSGGTNTPTVDIDGVWALPVEQSATLELRGLDNTTAGVFTLDPDRSGGKRQYLAGTSGSQIDMCDGSPRLPLIEPGNSLVTWFADCTGGTSDVTNAKTVLTLSVIPRWTWMDGLPWM